MAEEYKTELPWASVETWRLGEWYPMPIGFMERDNPGYIIDGYGIFRREEGSVDMDCVDAGAFTFADALRICEAKNDRRMIE